MPKKSEAEWKQQEVADEDVYDAISYLEPDPSEYDRDDSTTLAVGISLAILLIGLLVYVWLYP